MAKPNDTSAPDLTPAMSDGERIAQLEAQVATLTVAMRKMAHDAAESSARQRALWTYVGNPTELAARQRDGFIPAAALFPYVPGIAECDAEGNPFDVASA